MFSPRPLSPLQADLLLVFVTVLAAGGWIFSREVVAGLSPLTFCALRFFGSGLLLALLSRQSLQQLSPAQWRAAVRVGLIFGVAMVFWVFGLKLTTHIGVGSFLCALSLVIVPFIGLMLGDRPGRYVYIALPFAVVGLACISLNGTMSLGVAEACFLMSALLFALMYVLNSRAATHTPALPLTAIQLTVTGLIATAGALLFESPALSQPVAIWGWLLASMLIATCLRFVLQTHGMGLTPPSHSAIIMNLEPVWTALLASVWLDERMSGLQFSGCLLIFMAMLVSRWPAVRQWWVQEQRRRA